MQPSHHSKWIKRKFPIFYTISPKFQQQFTPSQLNSLEEEINLNQEQHSKQAQKTLKKLKKLASQTQKQFKSNKQLYTLLSTVRPQQIREITLAHKKIDCLKPLSGKRLEKVVDIDLAYNKIQDVQPLMRSEMTQLIYFNLAVNKISLLKGMELCKWHKVKVINLSRNQISSMEPLCHGDFPSLQKLDLSENLINKIQSFHKSNSRDLKHLSFRKNKIVQLAHAERFCFNKISELNIKENPMTNIESIQKLQPTTIRLKRRNQMKQPFSEHSSEEFIKYSYKLIYSKLIYKVNKQIAFLLMIDEMFSHQRNSYTSKHIQYATIDEFKMTEEKPMILPTKKIHFD